MIWINYMFRGPFALIAVSFIGFFMFLGAVLYAIFFNWKVGWSEFRDLPEEMLDWFKSITGIK